MNVNNRLINKQCDRPSVRLLHGTCQVVVVVGGGSAEASTRKYPAGSFFLFGCSDEFLHQCSLIVLQDGVESAAEVSWNYRKESASS